MNLIPFLLASLKRYWPAIPIILAIVLFWRVDSLRAGYKADLAATRVARALDRASYESAKTEAENKALIQRARDKAEYQEKANDADKEIAALRDDARARLLRAKSANRASCPAIAQAESNGAGISESLPEAAPGTDGYVQVEANTLAELAAYAIAARTWALSLGDEK